MPNSKQKLAKRKHRQGAARKKAMRTSEISNAKIKTINELYRQGSLPKELHERVTVKRK